MAIGTQCTPERQDHHEDRPRKMTPLLPSGIEVFEIPQPALRRRRVLDHPSSVVECQNARNICCALFDGGLRAERGHLETVAQVRSDAAEKAGLAGLEVRASRLADQVHGAPEIPAGGEDAAHLVGEPELTKILDVAGGTLQIAPRGLGEEGYGLVAVHHRANALVMLEVEMLEGPEGVILATRLLGHAVCDKASRRILRGGAIRL